MPRPRPPPNSRGKPTSSGHTLKRIFIFLFRPFWIIFAICLFLVLALVFAIPWIFKTFRPHVISRDGRLTKDRRRFSAIELEDIYDEKNRVIYRGADSLKQDVRDVLALPGRGPERHGRSKGEMLSFFITQRSWDMYELLREVWRMLHRQGLQVAGIFSALTILICQACIIGHDFNDSHISAFFNAWLGGPQHDDPHSLLTLDKNCGYVVGTGIANWSSNLENIVWFASYHASLMLLCLMLIGEELFNIRMGLFSPQWTRTGTGYSIIFLVACTLSTSPNWGATILSQSTYFLLFAIFLGGCFNVIYGFTTSSEACRNGRHALRPWTEADWQWHKLMPDFRDRAIRLEKRQKKIDLLVKAGSKEGMSQQETYDLRKKVIREVDGDTKYAVPLPKYWTERMQLKIGDRSWQLEDLDSEVRQVMGDGQGFHQIASKKNAQQKQLEQGQISRRWINGFPVHLPLKIHEDQNFIRDAQRGSAYKHGADFYGMHYWDPMDKEFELKGAEKIAWQERYKWVRYCCWWFNIRRIHASVCAVAMFALHIGLLIYENSRIDWVTYRVQDSAAISDWKSNHGPDDSKCQYYEGSDVPLRIQAGLGSLSGVSWNLSWILIWHIFILFLSLGVFLVAFTNNRTFGMHYSIPMSLLGPRTSSNSIGWTLGFLSCATLQLSLFFTEAPICLFIARTICYNGIISWAFHLLPNEPMKNVVVRTPFFKMLSKLAFEHMDKKKIHYEWPDADDD